MRHFRTIDPELHSSFQQLTVIKCSLQKLVMSALEPGSSGVESDCSDNQCHDSEIFLLR